MQYTVLASEAGLLTKSNNYTKHDTEHASNNRLWNDDKKGTKFGDEAYNQHEDSSTLDHSPTANLYP